MENISVLYILDYCLGCVNIIELTEQEQEEALKYDTLEDFLLTLESKYGFRLKNCSWMASDDLCVCNYKNGKEVYV